MFAYKMNSTIKYIPLKSTQDGRYDLSPFRVRTDNEVDHGDKKKSKKDAHPRANVTSSREQTVGVNGAPDSVLDRSPAKGISLQRWLQPVQDKGALTSSLQLDTNQPVQASEHSLKTKPIALEKSKAAQWTFTKAVHDSLNPSVAEQESEDYERYIRHPQNLPLVISSDTPVDVDASEYQEYVSGDWQDEGLMVKGTEEEIDVYAELLKVGENPLTVTEEDGPKKRYKAYRKWLRG